MLAALVLLSATVAATAAASPHPRDCTKLYNPQNYMNRLPTLSMPYQDSVAIPSNILPVVIRPTPVMTTRVIAVVTKLVSRTPVCIKVVGSKPTCGTKKAKNPAEYLVTKEYFVRDKKSSKREHKAMKDRLEILRREIQAYRKTEGKPRYENNNNTDLLKGSETYRSDSADITETPQLDDRTKEVLIEDRLDHLEEILPHYTRRRVYETTTVTVTKTKMLDTPTATLMVKNCIPEGMDFCKGSVNKKQRLTSKEEEERNSPPSDG